LSLWKNAEIAAKIERISLAFAYQFVCRPRKTATIRRWQVGPTLTELPVRLIAENLPVDTVMHES
jgi:hypothetical protein